MDKNKRIKTKNKNGTKQNKTMMGMATKAMIAFWFICPLQDNNANYGNNNKIEKLEQIKG